MSRVLLRTLARKSTLKFGKYYDLTVQQVIDLRGVEGLKALRWYYYQASNISFNDEVLNELGIHEAIRIEKPGKCTEPELVEYLKQVHRKDIPENDKYKAIRLKRAENKHRRVSCNRLTNLVKCKQFLMLRNTGKKFYK